MCNIDELQCDDEEENDIANHVLSLCVNILLYVYSLCFMRSNNYNTIPST